MVIRVATILLWLVAGSWASNYLGLLFGIPPILMLVLAGGVSVLVALPRLRPSWQVGNTVADPAPVVATSTQLSVRSNY